MKTLTRLLGIALIFCMVSACSTLSVSDDPQRHISKDPLKGLNKSIYAFNSTADKLVVRPVAKAYSSVVPKSAKKGINNFFVNLSEPISALNNLLQGKVDRALVSTFRFAVNSTIGVFGLFDVADNYGAERANEDFGQTLASWGVGPGPYVMLPFLGPSNLRDGVGLFADSLTYYPINEISDSSGTRLGLTALNVIRIREGLLNTDRVLDAQLDRYGFLKQAFEQNRIKSIYDGSPPQVNEDDYDF